MENDKVKKVLFVVGDLAAKGCRLGVMMTISLFFIGVSTTCALDFKERSELKTRLNNRKIIRR